MKDQTNNNPVTTLIRQIISHFSTTKTPVPHFDTMEQSTTEHTKKCRVMPADKNETIIPLIDPQDIPSATDYGSTY